MPLFYTVQGQEVRNIEVTITGTTKPNEIIVIGAHYDHLGNAGDGCRVLDPADTICNGATDNATGVATALAVAAGAPTSATRGR